MFLTQTSTADAAPALSAHLRASQGPLRIARNDEAPLSGRIPSLDGLRAVSILLVIVCHLARIPDGPLPRGAFWAPLGTIGVDVFFAISGFLITTLLLREQERNGAISLRGFYARRALRILPAFFAYLAVLVVFQGAGWIELVARDWAATLTYTVNFFVPVASPVSHIWSLSVEEHFYLVWPLLFALLGVRRAGRLALIGLLAEPAARWLTYRYGGGRFDIDFVTFARLDAIAAGCIMAIAARSPAERSTLRRLDQHPAIAFFVAMCVLLLSTFVLSRSGKYTIVARPSVNALAICAMIWTAARFPAMPFGRVLNWAPLAWLGGLSYGLYLWQQVFLDPANSRVWTFRFPQNLGLALGAAAASYYLVERPFLQRKNRLGRTGRAEVAPHLAGMGLAPVGADRLHGRFGTDRHATGGESERTTPLRESA